MRKNSQIHLFLETEVLQSLKFQAKELGISVSNLCRNKLRECLQLNRIEGVLKEINEKLARQKLNTKLNKLQEVKKW